MDMLDMKILSRLLNNCRESGRQIGMDLGVTGDTVRARIRRMRDAGTIENFFVKVEPPVLGYGILYFVVSGEEDVRVILEQVSLVGRPFVVVPCVGGVTVCGIVIKRDDPRQKVTELASRLMRDVRVLSVFEADGEGPDPDLTKTDLGILRELVADPLQRIEDVAEKTGVSAKTVARCIEKLQRNDGIQFTLVYDPRRIGRFIPHAVLAWISGDLRGTLREMNGRFSDSYLQVPFVAKNQIVLFMYSDSIFKVDEATQRIRDTKNVESTDLFIPKKILFYDEWLREAMDDLAESPTLHLSHRTTQ